MSRAAGNETKRILTLGPSIHINNPPRYPGGKLRGASSLAERATGTERRMHDEGEDAQMAATAARSEQSNAV